ncbi:MAG: FkbM family methyltransferase [Gemmataceae bacterium]
MNRLETTIRSTKRLLGLNSRSPIVAGMRPAYDWLLTGLFGRRGLSRVIYGGEDVRVLPAHRYVEEGYESPVFDYLSKAVRPGAVILDIGAHVGLSAILMARWAGPDGHVYAFEPSPQVRAALTKHLALNGVQDRVIVIDSAVSDRPGRAAFFAFESSPEGTLSATHSRLPGAQPVDVPVTTVDDFCATRDIAPTVIKIDIEGYEYHALCGARKVLERHRPVLVIELHPMNWAEIGLRREALAGLIADLGYRLIALENQSDALSEYGHVALEPLP